jgi:hypothetical protein
MKTVGHKSEKMWKRYNSIEEKDLTDAAVKVQKYLDVNTLITPSDIAVEGHSSKYLSAPVAQSDRASAF